MDILLDNIKIIKSQVNQDICDDDIIKLIVKHDDDIVNVILDANGELDSLPKLPPKKKLNKVETKIAELRDIVDKKDQLMDKLLSESRKKTDVSNV